MKTFDIEFHTKKKILALGGESAGNFSFYSQGKVYFSDDFGDLLEEEKFREFQKAVQDFVDKNGKPDIVISDLHPLFRTTKWGQELAKKFDAEFVQVQHHLAHIFSAVGDYIISCHDAPKVFIGIACDGTGYGLDEKIWGGEIFEFSKGKAKRVGKLEDQTLIGGELAIKEPARMLISILGKFLSKKETYKYVKNFYSKNEFELLWNQYQKGFNCLETSSTGRVLDAVSVFLGFSGNERPYKHAPIDLLEKNSTKPYEVKSSSLSSRVERSGVEGFLGGEGKGFLHLSFQEVGRNDKILELQTTTLFKYLVENLGKDKKRLAATSQIYLAKRLWEICQKIDGKKKIFFAGGIANNKVISEYLVSKGVIVGQEIPRGDAGLSFGQLIYYLSSSQF